MSTPTPSYDQPSLLFEMTEYIANNVCEFRFPYTTAHALRQATKRMAAVPRPPVTFDAAMQEMAARGDPHDADADTAFMEFATEACAGRPWLRGELILCAARHGCTPVCRALVGEGAVAPLFPGAMVCQNAASNGHRGTLEWARSAGFPWKRAFFEAAQGGHAELVRWMHEQVPLDDEELVRIPEDTVRGAARGGHLALLQWAVSLGWPPDSVACQAATGGHAHVLQWAVDSGNIPRDLDWLSMVVKDAAGGGHVAVLEWAVQRGGVLTRTCVRHAGLFGHLEALQWMRDQGTVDIGDAYTFAVLGGKLDVVRWLHGEGITDDGSDNLTVIAADAGNLEMLRLLHYELGVPTCGRECSQAAGRGGGPAVLRYLHENGLLDAYECLGVTTGWRRVAVAKWIAREVEGGAADVARVGFHNNTTIDSSFEMLMGRAAVRGDLPTVQWLHAEGCRVSEDAVWKHGYAVHPVVRKWLLVANL